MMTSTFRTFRTPIRGHAFAPRPPETMGPTPGQFARLIREPDNPADEYAVGVWVSDGRGRWRIGYLDRAVAARLAPRLDRGALLAAQIEGWTTEPEGRWRRPMVVVVPADSPSDPRLDPRSDPLSARGDESSSGRTTGLEATTHRASSRPAGQATGSPAVPAAAPRDAAVTRRPLWGRPPGVSRRALPTTGA